MTYVADNEIKYCLASTTDSVYRKVKRSPQNNNDHISSQCEQMPLPAMLIAMPLIHMPAI